MTAPDRTVAPPLHPLADINIAPAERIELDGGGSLTAVRGGDQPVMSLSLLWEGGTLDCPLREAMAVMGDCITEGTDDMSADEVADAVDYAGARLSFRPADHYSGLSLVCLSHRVTDVLPVLRSVITAPAFTTTAVETARARLGAATAVTRSKVSDRAERALKPMITGSDNPAATVTMPERFETVSPDDVRAAWQATIGRGRRGMHAFLGGSFSDETLVAIIDSLTALPSGEPSPSPIAIRPFCAEPPRRINITDSESLQSAVAMGRPTIGRDHPDYIPLRIAVEALGGYFGSRLMSNIREKRGLTYGISARLLGTYEGAYAWIGAQCNSLNVDEVIEQTLAEVRNLADNPPRGEELERLRLHAWSSLASQADTPLSTIEYYITRLTVGTPADYFARQMEAIRALDSDTIARMAATYLTGDWAIATCGPSAPATQA